MDSDASADSTEELQRRMEHLELNLLEAQALVDSKGVELQEVSQKHDKLEDVVAGVELKLSEKEDELDDIQQKLNDALSSDKVQREHADSLSNELELTRKQFELDKLSKGLTPEHTGA